MTASSGPRVIQWLIDTRNLWPEATKTKDLEEHVSIALPGRRLRQLTDGGLGVPCS